MAFSTQRDQTKLLMLIRRVTRGGRGEVYPILFQKLEKKALVLEKNALIMVIRGLNFSFEMQFLRVSRRKN